LKTTALALTLLALVTSASAQSASVAISGDINGGSPPIAGATTTYSLNISNEGPDDAANLQLMTSVPSGTTFNSLSAPPGWSCSTPPSGGTGSITCSIASFPPGFVSFTLVINVPRATAQGTVITLNAAVASTTADPDANDNTLELTGTVEWQSQLALSKSAPPSAFAGDPITYTLNVTNAGPSDAANVTLNDVLPAAFIVDSVTAPGWSCSTGPTVTCTNPQVGSSATVTIQGHTAPSATPGTLTNDADLSATTEPNTHAASADTVLTARADLSITKSGGPVSPGSDVTYTITVTNTGPSDAANVTVTDTLPPPLTLVSMSGAGWSCVGTTCTRAELAPGASAITLVAHVAPATPPSTTIINTATVTSTTSDPTTPNTANTSATTPSPASVSATKQISAGPYFETQPFTYTITLTNAGPGTQADNSGDEMTDVLPSSVTLLGASASSGTVVAEIVNNRVRWNGSIPAGGSVTITIQAVVNAGTAGSPIANQATISYDADGNGTNEATGTSNTATFTPAAASAIPALSHLALLALAAMLALLAFRS